MSQFSMQKRAVLRCDGSLQEGFRVTLEISDYPEGGTASQRTLGLISEAIGELPASPELIEMLEQWRQSYRQSLSREETRISFEKLTITTGSLYQLETCRSFSKTLELLLRSWLSHPGFQEIEQRLRESLNVDDEVEIFLRTRDLRLYQLPWHRWGFIERYSKAELVFSIPSERYETGTKPHANVRILAVLGDRRGIDTETDQRILESTPNAEVTFLVEPSRQDLYRYLWEQPWDILFFAGHSYTAEQQGILKINCDEQLSLDDLKYGLKKAIALGLKLAIFNSCDGLGLAYELEKLHIPQFVVMREPVPDRVAQEFLKRFLQTFSSGESLLVSVRQAREWLHSLEGDFPCASWLPILFQNPAMTSLDWHRITQPQEGTPQQKKPQIAKLRKLRLRGVIALSLFAGSLVIGVRSLGLLQPSELWAYDRMVQTQVNTTKIITNDTPKIRVIGITRKDTQQYGQEMTQENVISDRALADLIKKINRYQPKVIGLDIFRDVPQPDKAGYQQLLTALQSAPSLVVACQVGEEDQSEQRAVPSIAPPKISSSRLIGYADSLLPDDDSVVRRYMVEMAAREGSSCVSEQSFAWQIAKQVVQPQPFEPKLYLSADFGGYQGNPERFGEAQLLINYHPSSRNIQLFNLQDILNLNAESELQQLFQNSVVLIGYNLVGAEDTHLTPLGQQNGVMIHTHAVRQLLQQTPNISAWSQWVEMLLIMVGSILGGLLLWRVRSLKTRMILAIALSIGIQGLVYMAYLQYLWLPTVPVTLAFLFSIALICLLEKKLHLLSKEI
jgi:CHASE2 domain-containing sensor protein